MTARVHLRWSPYSTRGACGQLAKGLMLTNNPIHVNCVRCKGTLKFRLARGGTP